MKTHFFIIFSLIFLLTLLTAASNSIPRPPGSVDPAVVGNELKKQSTAREKTPKKVEYCIVDENLKKKCNLIQVDENTPP